MKRLILLSALVVFGSACAASPEVKPAPTAQRTGGIGHGATAMAQDVMLEVRTDVWRWEPRDLETKATPVRVSVMNGSGNAIELQYSHFDLVSSQGTRYSAIPPEVIKDRVPAPADSDVSDMDDDAFYTFNEYQSTYPDASPGMNTADVGYDPGYSSEWYMDLASLEFPTDAMKERALRETTLQPGETTEGFLYMKKVKGRDQTLEFVFDIVDAETGEHLDTVRIPMVTDSNV